MINILQCPVCVSTHIQHVLEAEDYTTTHEKFEIWECRECSHRFTQNIPSPNDIAKYYQSDEYISHTDTSKGFINRLYHIVRSRTLKKKLAQVKTVTGLATGRLLDVGAGTGAFVQAAQHAGWQVTGLEPDEATRRRAHDLHQQNLLPIENLFTLPAEAFDAITLWHVLEHVHELHPYMDQLKKLLKKNGRILIAVPNYTSHDAKLYGQYWAAYDVPRHLHHFSPASMKRLLELHQLSLLNTLPMWYDSFYISMLSEKYQHGKNHLLRSVWNGLVSDAVTAGNKERSSSVIYVIGK